MKLTTARLRLRPQSWRGFVVPPQAGRATGLRKYGAYIFEATGRIFSIQGCIKLSILSVVQRYFYLSINPI